MSNRTPVFLDCTLRDGGYHNAWDFPSELIQDYLAAMAAISVDYVELGFRSLDRDGFRGGCAFTTDGFVRQFDVPSELGIGVMVNVGEWAQSPDDLGRSLDELFVEASDSPVSLVRLATHLEEFDIALDACTWLQKRGYLVGVNLMQIADRSEVEIEDVARRAAERPPDVLYFADSMGSLDSDGTSRIVSLLRSRWDGPLGIHAHDNMGRALTNSLRAIAEGVSWVDATVTGMGRGPGNAKSEHLAFELAGSRQGPCDIFPLLSLIDDHFRPLQERYGWGTNPYYYLAGKFGIHPTYVQAMLADSRFGNEDILAVLEHLSQEGGKKFRTDALETGRNFYHGAPGGSWEPADYMKGRDVVVLGSGPGTADHWPALAAFIRLTKPVVLAVNAAPYKDEDLIDFRVASHPFRLLSNAAVHLGLSQPLITPVSALPESVLVTLEGKELMDFGLVVKSEIFEFGDRHCVLPASLAALYALGVAASGRAARILMVGFDGFPNGDPRNDEMDLLLKGFQESPGTPPVAALTPTRYCVAERSVYSLL